MTFWEALKGSPALGLFILSCTVLLIGVMICWLMIAPTTFLIFVGIGILIYPFMPNR